MARGPGGRVEAMTRADARTRLKTARMYLTAAELILDESADEAATVATGNAVLAGIAAADAICAYASGERYRGPDHRPPPTTSNESPATRCSVATFVS